MFRLFEREGVLDLLEREYEDLHGMGMEYMMQFLDEYLGERVEKCCIAGSGIDNAGEGMEHYLIRATIIPGIVERIQEYYHMTEREALRAFYHSATGASLADDETGLYGQSELFLFGLFLEEERNLWEK